MCGCDTGIARAGTTTILLPNYSNLLAVLSEDRERAISRAVVDNDDLAIRIGLPQSAVKRLAQVSLGVVGRNDYAD